MATGPVLYTERELNLLVNGTRWANMALGANLALLVGLAILGAAFRGTQLGTVIWSLRLLAVLACGGALVWCLVSLGTGLRWSVGRIVLTCLGVFCPILGLLLLFDANRVACHVLKQHGYTIGFLGARPNKPT